MIYISLIIEMIRIKKNSFVVACIGFTALSYALAGSGLSEAIIVKILLASIFGLMISILVFSVFFVILYVKYSDDSEDISESERLREFCSRFSAD